MLPIGVLMAFAAMKLLGVGSNIISLRHRHRHWRDDRRRIVMIENAHKHLERAPEGKPRLDILIEAANEVGRRCSSVFL